jgi:type I restriction enzyme M protein
VALIVGEGWAEDAKPRAARVWKDKNNKTKYEDAHLTFGTGANAKRWVMDLLPPTYVIARFFADEQAQVDKLTSQQEAASQVVAEYVEEHAVEGGLLYDAADEDGKLTNKLAADHLKLLKSQKGDPEEIAAVSEVVALFKAEAAAKKAVKDATTQLNNKALAQYGKLAADDIQSLVIDDKWRGTVSGRIGAEVTAFGQALIARLRVLADRYESTGGELDAEVESLGAKVAEHLAAMGVKE